MSKYKDPKFLARIDSSSPEYCDRCNYDRHTCPGCGDNLPHELNVCNDCKKYADKVITEEALYRWLKDD